MEKTSVTAIVLAVVALVASVVSLSNTPESVVERVVEREKEVGAIPGGEYYNEVAFLGGVRDTEKVVSLAPTSQYATTTLQLSDSGTMYSLSASGTSVILPAVTHTGANFRFQVGGALDTANVVVDSAEGDNINGTLSVNNADVACSGEDQINFVTDGETVGDYVQLVSDGSQWLIQGSDVETAAKMTCTDPS